MHTRGKSKQRAAEAREEVSMAEKESTSVEEVETVDKAENRGEPNVQKMLERMLEKMDRNEEKLKQMNEKFDSIKKIVN